MMVVFVGAVAVGIAAVPGLRRLVVVATERRPAVWPVTAVAVGAALLIAWRATGVLHAAALAPVAASGIAAGWIDAYERRLPDALILPLYPVVGALLIAAGDTDRMLRAALLAAAAIGLFGLGCAAGQMGFGDVKLAGLLALVLAWSDWRTAAVALAATAAVGGGQAAAVLALGRRDFPYGPAILAGAAAALAFGPLGT
ncbi:leader peptidase (prepilin peptidase) / N-methyltransferase [Glycomyces sambucus]|uniref:Leader peptidase (Prepilin peptidase) / N-methyltransferase n=1 Tax=Glycomyces sambucus TaxID=380244 RepID=A0A1G9IHB7_9ACTN|nr:leader peptidase (prepilin peptidase) / N-methyltransferase [Glycomyces sambucus]